MMDCISGSRVSVGVSMDTFSIWSVKGLVLQEWFHLIGISANVVDSDIDTPWTKVTVRQMLFLGSAQFSVLGKPIIITFSVLSHSLRTTVG